MSKEYTRDIFTWLNQVAKDPDLQPSASRVAIVLTTYFNRQTGYAWPSVNRIAGDLGINEATARRALLALKALGHLNIVEGGGRSTTNRYYPTLKHSQNCEGYSGATLSELNGNPLDIAPKPSQDCDPNHYKNHDKNHFTRNTRAREIARLEQEEEIKRVYMKALGLNP